MELHIPTITTPCPENFAEKHDESILRDIEKVITTASLMVVVTATGINPLSINGMEQLTKYFEVVAELHKMGYEQIRMTEYASPNGTAMRCWITVKSRCWNIFGGFIEEKGHDDPLAIVSLNGEFAWDTSGMSPHAIAEEFIRRYPAIAEAGRGRDAEYVKWFSMALNEARQGYFFSALMEWRNWMVEGQIDLGNGHYLPLPPPGTSETESIY